MTELSPKARELLRRASRGGGPTEGQRRALKRTIMAAVLMPAVAGAAAAKIVLAVLLVAAVSAGVTVATLRASRQTSPAGSAQVAAPSAPPQLSASPPAVQPPPAIPQAAAPAAQPGPEQLPHPPAAAPAEPQPLPLKLPPPPRVITQVPAVQATPGLEPAQSSPPPEVAPAGAWAPSVRATGAAGFARELESLDRAVRAVEEKRFEEGMEEARGFLRNFPASELGTEARVIEVLALCGLSRPEDARAAASTLPVASAGNPAVRRLESSCVGSAAP